MILVNHTYFDQGDKVIVTYMTESKTMVSGYIFTSKNPHETIEIRHIDGYTMEIKIQDIVDIEAIKSTNNFYLKSIVLFALKQQARESLNRQFVCPDGEFISYDKVITDVEGW